MDKSPHLIPVRLAAIATVLCLCSLPTACASDPTPVSAADGGITRDRDAESTDTAVAAAAPTYAELFDTYFAKGTPGHCATAGCHADPGHNVWLCGTDADTCYRGMMEMGLINADHPEKSLIADVKRSPVTWVNQTGGTMPLDAQGPNAAAKAAIEAWVAAGAPRE